MKYPTVSPAQRWFALVLVLVSVCFTYFSPWFSGEGKSIKDVSDEYANLFMPAPYAFSVWGLIYLAVIAYAVVQALPGQKNERAYHELSFSLSFLSILSMCWLLSFLNEILLLSEIIIVAMLITSVYALVKARTFADQNALGKWAVVPFSLYAGWLSVATIANTSAWLVSEGFTGGTLGAERWAEIMLVIAVVLGILVSFRFRDFVYPSMIGWGVVAIWASWRTTSAVSTTALIGGIILAIVAILNVLRNNLSRSSRRKPSLHEG